MRVLRSKSFANPLFNNNSPQDQQTKEVTSRDLQIEQMKQQRQLLQTQRMREKLQAQERRDVLRHIRHANKDAAEEKADQVKTPTRLTQEQNDQNEGARNVGLYKTRAKAVPPVPMKH